MDAAEVASSPGSLSSPPHSPEQGTPNNSAIHATSGGYGVAANASTPTPAASTTPTPRLTAAGTVRKKPGPKPKPKDPNAEEKKPRKPRKAAEPKDPNAAPAPRKRRTKASLEAQNASPAPADEKPAVNVLQQQSAPQTRPAELAQVLQPEQSAPVTQPPPPPRALGASAEPLHGNPNLSHITPTPSTPRPASSGQRYDPIRGGIYESKPLVAASVPPPPISPPLNRASASPSITSLIDPPTVANSTYTQPARLQHPTSVTSAPLSPAAISNRPGPLLPSQDNQPPPRPAAPLGPAPMDIDSDPRTSVPMKKTDSASAGTLSNAPTPPVKARQKEAPPPLPTGSGLLSGTPFGPAVGVNGNGATEPSGVNIWLTFPLKGQTNVTINFAQEVEKKYGFAALHPRIAARRERQRQITSMGAALEKAAGLAGSADDMSVDLSDNESNGGNTGMDEEGSAAGKAKKPRKRKQEDYDKEDDFIDDTELAWEQQALMAKDGFFVYSGPLITEEKPAVERADGTVKRGRGRGRAAASRGETSGRGRGRGGGPGSRGGQTVRKPRVTKADRAMMEQEKAKRIEFSQQLGSNSNLANMPVTAHAGTVHPTM
ncbi:HPC2-domain-containing protein [Paraphaeosphaeria sporulosa]|uniref:HPC2-domain-containing protein n=1 Tax=Paraphaeosphaeria sporulosa TaxID=1460663 RepID=A0A177BZ95_9PLEO|nr:HPC2-domain-containing protein [Paraphaeosphaeria sporulosa]OAF99766.1 HPC2-domain-containing protein [Paraphaeosphaeria sporulosa]